MSENPGEIYIGLMSGTSLDGIDISIVDFANTEPSVLHCSTVAYDESLRDRIRNLTHSRETTLDNLYTLDTDLGTLYAETVNRVLELASLDRSTVVALGCHGQTIRHRPDIESAYTAQLGDPNRVATLTGITTIADFRRKDVALGGQGAPLACAFHKSRFYSSDEDRAVINIGGIANITYLPADRDQPVIGFDTGPGNTLGDYWIRKNRDLPYDAEGDWASGGQILEPLLQKMISQESYFTQKLPKTTGTEYFNPGWLRPFIEDAPNPVDLQTTLVELTALTIADALKGLPSTPGNCYICGGGAHNKYLLDRLAKAIPDSNIQTTQNLGVDPDFVESIAFAWLARERIERRSGNLPDVTHAYRSGILGGIYEAD